MAKYYAAENVEGFANTWAVLVFDSRQHRDNYVEARDGSMNRSGNPIDCRAILRDEVTGYAANWSQTRDELIEPKPFSGQCWMYSDMLRENGDSIPGYLGDVYVGYPDYDHGERVF